MSASKDTYELITARIIEKIDKGGILPWHKPWKRAEGERVSSFFSGRARNLVSKKPYRGINALMLGTSDFENPFWATFHQVKELGGSVRKGSKSEMVVFVKRLPKHDEKGNPVVDDLGREVTIPFLRYSSVFNFEQCDGLKEPNAKPIVAGELPATKPEPEPIETAQAIVDAAQAAGRTCRIYNRGSRACYSPFADVIEMPLRSSFENLSNYHHTLFHEMIHATGHDSRLDRFSEEKGKANFGSENYAKEELVAEIGASFLGNHTGILSNVVFENSVAYLDNWIAALKRDTKLIIGASSAAQKAADYLLGETGEQ